MKSILFFTVIMCSFVANAQDPKTTILSERNLVINADIMVGNVKLSRADYAMPLVKILVPELADVTALNHRNFREGAPCLSTLDTNNPDDVIQGNPQTEKITLKIKLVKTASLIADQGLCVMTLTESIDGVIRGHRFVHDRSIELPSRVADDCR